MTMVATLGTLCFATAMLSYVGSRTGEHVWASWLIMAVVTFFVGAALIAFSLRVRDAAER